jgi:hypothetical protein
MLLVPVLAGKGGGIGDIAITMLKAAIVIASVLFASSSKHKEPRTFYYYHNAVVPWHSTPHFQIGLSLALGAFLAGICHI